MIKSCIALFFRIFVAGATHPAILLIFIVTNYMQFIR